MYSSIRSRAALFKISLFGCGKPPLSSSSNKNIEIHHKKFKVATYDQNSGILHNHLDDTYHRIDGNNANEKSDNAARIVTDSVKKHDESPFNLKHYAIYRDW